MANNACMDHTLGPFGISIIGYSVISNLIGPHLRAVQNTQDANCMVSYRIGHDIRRSHDDKLSSACDSARSSALREIHQTSNGQTDLFVDVNRCCGIFSLDVIEYRITVKESTLCPNKFPH